MNFAQLEQLWTTNGGAPAMAPIMAAIALAESSGTPNAEYQTTSADYEGATGLWQVEWPLHQATQQKVTGTSTRKALLTPTNNAKMAVALATSSTLSAWQTDRAWNQWVGAGSPHWPTSTEALGYLKAAGVTTGTASATGPASTTGSTTPGSTSTTSSTSSTTGQSGGLTSIWSQATGALKDVNTLTHDAALVLDRVFGMFAPGQGMRIGIFAATGLCAFSGLRSWRDAASDEQGSSFPLAVLLIGLAVVGAFLALRPWPTPGGKPIKAGAYVVDVFKGHPPAVKAQTSKAAVTAIQAGLDSLLVLWAVGKAAGAANAVANGFRNLGGNGGKGSEGTETGEDETPGDDVTPGEEVPEVPVE